MRWFLWHSDVEVYRKNLMERLFFCISTSMDMTYRAHDQFTSCETCPLRLDGWGIWIFFTSHWIEKTKQPFLTAIKSKYWSCSLCTLHYSVEMPANLICICWHVRDVTYILWKQSYKLIMLREIKNDLSALLECLYTWQAEDEEFESLFLCSLEIVGSGKGSLVPAAGNLPTLSRKAIFSQSFWRPLMSLTGHSFYRWLCWVCSASTHCFHSFNWLRPRGERKCFEKKCKHSSVL